VSFFILKNDLKGNQVISHEVEKANTKFNDFVFFYLIV